MWWTGRFPGMSEEEDHAILDQDRTVEQLGPDMLFEILELLGDSLPSYIPPIDFQGEGKRRDE